MNQWGKSRKSEWTKKNQSKIANECEWREKKLISFWCPRGVSEKKLYLMCEEGIKRWRQTELINYHTQNQEFHTHSLLLKRSKHVQKKFSFLLLFFYKIDFKIIWNNRIFSLQRIFIFFHLFLFLFRYFHCEKIHKFSCFFSFFFIF